MFNQAEICSKRSVPSEASSLLTELGPFRAFTGMETLLVGKLGHLLIFQSFLYY